MSNEKITNINKRYQEEIAKYENLVETAKKIQQNRILMDRLSDKEIRQIHNRGGNGSRPDYYNSSISFWDRSLKGDPLSEILKSLITNNYEYSKLEDIAKKISQRTLTEEKYWGLCEKYLNLCENPPTNRQKERKGENPKETPVIDRLSQEIRHTQDPLSKCLIYYAIQTCFTKDPNQYRETRERIFYLSEKILERTMTRQEYWEAYKFYGRELDKHCSGSIKGNLILRKNALKRWIQEKKDAKNYRA